MMVLSGYLLHPFKTRDLHQGKNGREGSSHPSIDPTLDPYFFAIEWRRRNPENK